MKIISPLRGLEIPKLEVLLILIVFKSLELEVATLGFCIYHVLNQHAASRIISFQFLKKSLLVLDQTRGSDVVFC